jgi:hypothetical protein
MEAFLMRYVFIDFIAYILYFAMIIYIVKQHDSKIVVDKGQNGEQ